MKRLFFSFSLILAAVSASYSQETRFSVRANVGAAYLPLTAWNDFVGKTNLQTDLYEICNPIVYGGASVIYRISEEHFVSIASEVLRPQRKFVGSLLNVTSNSDTIGFFPLRIDWNFTGIPLTLGYEYHTGFLKNRFEPVVGIGVSYFFSEVTTKSIVIDSPRSSYFKQNLKRTGRGYGVNTSIAFQTKLNDSFKTLWQIRYRYSNGMAFTDNKGDIKVEFSGFDFAVGVEYSL